MRIVVILLSFSFLLMACASNDSAQSPKQYIDLTPEDQRRFIYKYWVLDKRQEPGYPASAIRNDLSGCVDLIVGINKEGKVDGFQIKKSYPKGLFDNHASAALKGWRWSASKNNSIRSPVLTIIQLDFNVSGSRNKTEAEKQCKHPRV